jgi:hypothetical protein
MGVAPVTDQVDSALLDFIYARMEEMPRDELQHLASELAELERRGGGGPPVGVDGPVDRGLDSVDSLLEASTAAAILTEVDPLAGAYGRGMTAMVRAFAAFWKDHPDYRSEWAPR